MPENEQPRTSAFREYGVTGLDTMAGMVLADPESQMRGKRGAEQYDLMRHEDSTVAAMLLALTLPIRQARWRVHPASSKPADIEAAEFVETVMHDMSHSWDDFLTEACTMFAFGWSYMEWVLKRRKGNRSIRGSQASSNYDDGRIGFRKIVLRAQTSLYEWALDEAGGINGMWQSTLTRPVPVLIPLRKSLLFRTSRERNNPEGFSILRPAWRDWKYKRNLERIEAIGLQRALQGLPVMTLWPGSTAVESQAGSASHEAKAQEIIKGLHSNKLLGVIEEHERMTLDFKHPKMTGVTADSDRVIKRKDESIARTALGMYILLGSRERGSYALAKELGELFFLAVDGFLAMITQIFNNFAVPILFRYNVWPDLEGYPEVTANVNRGVDLDRLAQFINKMVQSQVLTPDRELERYLRDLADFPPMAVQIGEEVPEPVTPQEEAEEEPTGAQVEEASQMERFVQLRPEFYTSRTNAYQYALRQTYAEWADGAVDELLDMQAGEGESAIRRRWRELVLAGLLLLKKRGWEWFGEGFALGYESRALGPEMRAIIEEELAANEKWLTTNLFARVERSLDAVLHDALMLAWAGEIEQAREMLTNALYAIRGNVGQYAGHYWRMIWLGMAERLRARERLTGEKIPVVWVMDELAKHCDLCPVFAQEYTSIDALLARTGGILPGQGTICDGNCRCEIHEL